MASTPPRPGPVSGNRRNQPDFLFGVATADHQCEAYEFQDDIVDVWERSRALTKRGKATEFWTRYGEDVEHARALGCNSFRLSIAWSRVEPDEGGFSEAALEHYRTVVEGIRERGMQPIVTLHHFTWPVWLENRDRQGKGMLAEDFPELFARYAGRVAERLPQVEWWVTLNEPNLLVFGYFRAFWDDDYRKPPGLDLTPDDEDTADQELRAVARLIPNLFRAHKLGRDAIRKTNPGAMVGTNSNLLGLYPPLRGYLESPRIGLTAAEDDPKRLVKQLLQPLGQRPREQHGTADVVVAMLSHTPDRALKVFLSETYFVAGQMLLVKATSVRQPPIKQLGDVEGRTVVVVQSSTAERGIDGLVERGLLPRVEVRVVRDYRRALEQLDREDADAILADNTILRGVVMRYGRPGVRYRLVGRPPTPDLRPNPFAQRSPYDLPYTQLSLPPELRVAEESAEPITKEYYAVAVPQGDRELQDLVNLAVRRFKQGPWGSSYQAHLGAQSAELAPGQAGQATPEAPRQVKSTPPGDQQAPQRGEARASRALDRIRKRGKLVVAVRDDIPGFGDVGDGRPSGLEIDLAREIARQVFEEDLLRSPNAGVDRWIEYRPVRTNRRLPALRLPAGPLLDWPGLLADRLLQVWGWVADLADWLWDVKALRSASFLFSNWWLLGMAGKLPKSLCPLDPSDGSQQDYVGLDYYWGTDLGHFWRLLDLATKASAGLFDQAPVYPGGLYRWLEVSSRLFPNLPIVIMENGCVGKASGVTQADYIGRHFEQVRRAVRAGFNVAGYVCWSITSNREWGLQFDRGNDFGLYHVELDADPELRRVPTSAARAYQELIASSTQERLAAQGNPSPGL